MGTIIGYILVGLIAGSIANSIMPGRAKTGFWSLVFLGIIGSFIGGFLGGLLLNVNYYSIVSVKGIVLAVIGAVIVLAFRSARAR